MKLNKHFYITNVVYITFVIKIFMNSFNDILFRLKKTLNIQLDKDISDLLDISQRAFAARKNRDSFPEDKLFALTAKRPDLKIDVSYVLTGKPSPLMTRSEAKKLGVLTSDTKDIFDKFEAEDDGDESRDDEPFNINTPPTYRLSQDEWELIKLFRNASLMAKTQAVQILMDAQPKNKDSKTAIDDKPATISVSGNNNRTAGRNYTEGSKKK